MGATVFPILLVVMTIVVNDGLGQMGKIFDDVHREKDLGLRERDLNKDQPKTLENLAKQPVDSETKLAGQEIQPSDVKSNLKEILHREPRIKYPVETGNPNDYETNSLETWRDFFKKWWGIDPKNDE